MFCWRTFGLAALSIVLLSGTSVSQAQVSIEIGAAPVCPHGYYDYAPNNCSAYGYCGPDWFTGGLFIGTGPSFHGRRGFMDMSTTRTIPAMVMPGRGEQPFNHFHANDPHDGQGHAGLAAHDPGGEHSAFAT
jgi:hypothetical protein